MAAELILILSDFFAPTDLQPAADRPRLPALETLLATAQRRPLRAGWRAELAAEFGDARLDGCSPAALFASRVLDPSESAAHLWLATPVHYFAGLDRVQLHPAGLLTLSADSQAALAADFNAVFADGRWRLHATGRRELLLAGPALEAGGEDPARYLGAELDGAQPRGPEAAELRRLAVEIEMWLHEHPINRERQADAALPVSGLWLWGSEPLRVPAGDRPANAAVLYGEDAVAESLWLRRGGPCESLPEGLPQGWLAARAARTGPHVVLYPTAAPDGLAAALARLDRDWVAPALSALRAGTLAAVQLLAGADAYRQRRLDRLRFWRPRVPWQEALA